jgi:hypothetical protein
MIYKEFEHAPNSKLDYGFDWTLWLATGETVATSNWTTDLLANSSPANTGTVTSVFVEGGVVGTSYKLVNTITTSVGRIDSRTIKLSCKNR